MTPRFRLDSAGYPEQVTHLRAEFERRGWEETDGDDWQFLWSFDLPPDTAYRRLRADQLVNHYPGVGTVHYKDEFARHVISAGGDDIVPETFHLGRDYDAWTDHARRHPELLWIIKPTALTGGRGTHLVRDPDEVPHDERAPGWIAQRYVDDPFLLPGEPYKHSLRVYALVSSLEPLVAHVYPNGPAKFTSRPFGTAPEELSDLVRHLTNPSIQHTNTDVADPVRATDWIDYAERLTAAGIDAAMVRDSIDRAVTRALVATHEPLLRLSRYRCDQLGSCYELLGYDVTLDADLRPWLVECNASPSLGLRGSAGSDTEDAQRRSKQPMIGDTLTLLGVNEPGAAPSFDRDRNGDRQETAWQRIL